MILCIPTTQHQREVRVRLFCFGPEGFNKLMTRGELEKTIRDIEEITRGKIIVQLCRTSCVFSLGQDHLLNILSINGLSFHFLTCFTVRCNAVCDFYFGHGVSQRRCPTAALPNWTSCSLHFLLSCYFNQAAKSKPHPMTR